jgi:hypothetical protein
VFGRFVRSQANDNNTIERKNKILLLIFFSRRRRWRSFPMDQGYHLGARTDDLFVLCMPHNKNNNKQESKATKQTSKYSICSRCEYCKASRRQV